VLAQYLLLKYYWFCHTILLVFSVACSFLVTMEFLSKWFLHYVVYFKTYLGSVSSVFTFKILLVLPYYFTGFYSSVFLFGNNGVFIKVLLCFMEDKLICIVVLWLFRWCYTILLWSSFESICTYMYRLRKIICRRCYSCVLLCVFHW